MIRKLLFLKLLSIYISAIGIVKAQESFYVEFNTPLSDIVAQVEEDEEFIYALVNSLDFSKSDYFNHNTCALLKLDKAGKLVDRFDYENKDTATLINRFLLLPGKKIMLLSEQLPFSTRARLDIMVLDSNLDLSRRRVYGHDSLSYRTQDARLQGDSVIICGGFRQAFVFVSNIDADSLSSFYYSAQSASQILYFEQLVHSYDSIWLVSMNVDPTYKLDGGTVLASLNIKNGEIAGILQPRSLKTINFSRPSLSKGYFELLNDSVIIACGESTNTTSPGVPLQYSPDALLILYDFKNAQTLKDYFFGVPDYYDIVSGRPYVRYSDELVILTSVTRYPDSVKYYLHLERTDLSGGIKWKKDYDHNKNCYNFNMLKSRDGGFYVCGGTEQSLRTRWENRGAGFIVKFDSSGQAPLKNTFFDEKASVSIYPNPTVKKLNIGSGEDIVAERILLVDATGKSMMELNGKHLPLQLDLESYSLLPGVYFLIIDAGNNHYSFKVLVN